MLRRVAESNGQAPPAGLVSYPLWCAENGRRAYGNPRDRASMYEALELSQAWEEARADWCRRRRVDPLDLPMSADSDLPWDPDFEL
jgi:hypothetical protein